MSVGAPHDRGWTTASGTSAGVDDRRGITDDVIELEPDGAAAEGQMGRKAAATQEEREHASWGDWESVMKALEEEEACRWESAVKALQGAASRSRAQGPD